MTEGEGAPVSCGMSPHPAAAEPVTALLAQGEPKLIGNVAFNPITALTGATPRRARHRPGNA